MGKNKDLPREITEALQKSATDNHALLMSFIAPDKIVRTSPVNYDYASISVNDLYHVEQAIEELEGKNIELPEKLHLVIHTPGGSLYIATKIAKFFRKYFKDIVAFVPYEAASGGTIMCLAADEIVMGKLANLTPIDPQKNYKGQQVSTATFQQTIDEFQNQFGKQSTEEIESPYQQMGKTFDPIILKEMNKIVFDTIGMAWDLLKKTKKFKNGKENASLGIAWTLTTSNRPHSHVIDVDEAKEIGLPIVEEKAKLEILRVYKKWVAERLSVEQASHVIECFYPVSIEEKINEEKETHEKDNLEISAGGEQ